MELRKTFRFEAAHMLPKHPGRCSRLHGHSWVLHVFVKGEVNPKTGFVIDYQEISEIVQPIVSKLDHSYLGQPPLVIQNLNTHLIKGHIGDFLPDGFYPTSENLCMLIASKVDGALPDWSKIAIEETCTSYCELTYDEYHKQRDFENSNS